MHGAHLVLPQLLLYNVVSVLHGLLQPPEAWVGEELRQGARECSSWEGSLFPTPTSSPRSREYLGSTSSP